MVRQISFHPHPGPSQCRYGRPQQPTEPEDMTDCMEQDYSRHTDPQYNEYGHQISRSNSAQEPPGKRLHSSHPERSKYLEPGSWRTDSPPLHALTRGNPTVRRDEEAEAAWEQTEVTNKLNSSGSEDTLSSYRKAYTHQPSRPDSSQQHYRVEYRSPYAESISDEDISRRGSMGVSPSGLLLHGPISCRGNHRAPYMDETPDEDLNYRGNPALPHNGPVLDDAVPRRFP